MSNKSEFPKDMKMFDCNALYKVPMIRSYTANSEHRIEDIVECRITPIKYGYYVNAIKEGYERKFFYDLYFDWLLKIKYITKVSK